ncbi:MAG: hypothetical protein WDN49_10680 [Acetobacteraceae bacterium]
MTLSPASWALLIALAVVGGLKLALYAIDAWNDNKTRGDKAWSERPLRLHAEKARRDNRQPVA